MHKVFDDLRCVGLQEFAFHLITVLLVEPNDVVQGVGPHDGLLTQGPEGLLALNLFIVPVGDLSDTFDSLDELLGLIASLSFTP